MTPLDSDAAILAFLRECGPGTVSVRRISEKTGVPRVTVRASVGCLAESGLVCVISEDQESVYVVRHLHAGPGPCGHSLRTVIREA